MKRPSEEKSEFWLYSEDPKLSKIHPSPFPSNDGYWMMFFDASKIDAKWQLAIKLYFDGKFTGVRAIKVSTAASYSWVTKMPENFRNSDDPIHVIIFQCGPSENMGLMIDIGKILLKFFNYKVRSIKVDYKNVNQIISLHAISESLWGHVLQVSRAEIYRAEQRFEQLQNNCSEILI